MISIRRTTESKTAISELAADELEELRNSFDRTNCLELPGFLEPDLCDEIVADIKEADWYGQVTAGGAEQCMTSNPALAKLLLMANDERLFEAIRGITSCERIGCFWGRVYRLGAGGESRWHTDDTDHRMVALSVNLGTEPFSGGGLEIEDGNTGEIGKGTIGSLGDALIFRIGPHLKHRVTPVEGAIPRISFAGFFKEQPSTLSIFREIAALTRAQSQ
jgi:hypothetical protein